MLLDRDRDCPRCRWTDPWIGESQVPTADAGTLPRHLRRLANEARVVMVGPHPSVELVTIAGGLRATSCSPAVPWTCPKHRIPAVTHGHPRFVPMPCKL
jgi:hypothetical protein